MPDISIDRLALQVPFMSEAQGHRLAMGIANGLAVAGLSSVAGEVPTLRIDLTANAGADPDRLAEQVVAQIVRQLRQLP
jgi:hypothetical protein